jgi:hypothetical protein
VPTDERAASDEMKITVLSVHITGRNCCTRKNGARRLTA